VRTAIATVCLSGTLEDKLTAIAAAGFDGVEIFENDLICAPESPSEIGKRCADLGLDIQLYQPFRDFESVPPELLAANLRRAEHKFTVMERLGVDTMLVCSSVSPDAVDDDDLAAEQLHLLAERAAGHGLRIAYEALAWGRFVDTYDHSWRIVRRADHPALGVCLDSFHVLSKGSDPAGIRTIPGEKVFFLQLADAPRLHMDVLQWSRHHRLFPGQGAFDLTGFVANVLAAGYSGPLSLEVFNDVFRQADPTSAAVDAMRSLLSLREQLAVSGPARVRDRVRVAELPPAQPLAGYAFTELALAPSAGAEVANTLAALGFTHTGQHRTKPVQLWEQGRARVLLNTHDQSPQAVLSAIAVDLPDPGSAARRATRLLAPVLPREHAADEAELSSVEAPDGTALFLCRTEATGGWLADFSPTGNESGPGTGLTGVDHVALSQPFDHFDEAGVFYRSVLGLAPEHTAEVAAPFGLVRSLAVTDPDHTVRIALDAALLRRGDWAPGVPDPQHVCFTSNDIIATAAALRENGAPVLSISDNYYDDLAARRDLAPELLDVLREHHLLYDRDEHGEYLHFYTAVLGSRVFFEVGQRIDGYTGYGQANAPVRMAAHRHHRLATTCP
jgi:4-hydroxyphenylpyruvate dioxygenase